MTPNELEKFRTHVPECELAVFADLKAQSVLSSDGALLFPQEYQDALCATAILMFDTFESHSDGDVDHIIFLGPTGGRAFFRSASEPHEALCCIVAPDTEIARFLKAACSALDKSGDPK